MRPDRLVDTVMYLFLQEDYEPLEGIVAILRGRKEKALGSLGETSTQSSESWHDNPMFDFMMESAKMWQNQMSRLDEILRLAVLVQPSRQTDVVEIGNVVRFRNLTSQFDDELTIGSYMRFGPSARSDSVAAAGSPIGEALLGRSVGETVVAVFRDDKGYKVRELELKIVEIALG